MNAEGYSTFYDAISYCYVGMGRCRSHLRKKPRLARANWMALTCAVGEFVIPLQEIQAGEEASARYLPLNEAALTGTIFSVGQNVEFRAISSGQLICFANDAQSEYWNNEGMLNVTVTRVSWPPIASTYYNDLYLPACDSARVVYANYGWNDANLTKTEIASHKLQCNPNGGGAGWKLEDIVSHSARYDSGIPNSVLHGPADLS